MKFKAPKPWVPLPYMLEAMEFLVERTHAGLFLEPGLRKTSIVLGAFISLKEQKLVDTMLVTAPLRVAYSVWPREIRKWKDFNHLKIVVLHGHLKNELLRAKADVYVINYDGMRWLYEQLQEMKEWPFDILVVDESSKVRNTQTVRFKMLKPMLRFFDYRYILTGSPAPSSLLNLFGQIFILDMGRALGAYFTQYRRQFFLPAGQKWVLKKGSEPQIYNKVKNLVLRMAAKDYLKMPKLIINDVEVILPPDVRREYDRMENELLMQYEGGHITAANVGVSLGKCRQITGGAVYVDQKRNWIHVHEEKIDALVDIIEELEGQQALLVFEYIHEAERIKEKFPDAEIMDSKVSPKHALDMEDRWNSGELQLLLGHPQSMGHGLNLQDGGVAIIMITPTWNYEDYDQIIRRMYRDNRKKPVIVHRLLCPETVDDIVVRQLAAKEKGQNKLLDFLGDYFKSKKKSLH